MEFVVILAIVIAALVVPVMLAARFVGAGRLGFGSVSVAVILQSALSLLTRSFAPNLGVALLVAVVAGSAIYAFVLDTTLVKGILIGVISTAIAVVVIVLLGSLFAGGTSAI